MGEVESLEIRQPPEPLNFPNDIVAQVESIKELQFVEVLNLFNAILVEKPMQESKNGTRYGLGAQASQFLLVVQVFNLADAIGFQPQALDTSILFQPLNADKTYANW